jgi:hypothetical protein
VDIRDNEGIAHGERRVRWLEINARMRVTPAFLSARIQGTAWKTRHSGHSTRLPKLTPRLKLDRLTSMTCTTKGKLQTG